MNTATRDDSSAAERSVMSLLPPVDVTEDENGITVIADVPGATRESLSLRIDGDTLSLEAPIGLELPEGMEPVYAEVRAAQYRRSFTLSGELDRDRIQASLKDGVLRLDLPKREEARPRRIEVRTG
jgi:HSP20 family protein